MKPNTNYTQPEPELELIKASEITPTEVEWLTLLDSLSYASMSASSALFYGIIR